MAIFSSAHLKLNRANDVITELERLLAEHLKENPIQSEFTGGREADDGGPNWASGKVSFPIAPPQSAVLVGDIIHNMRTALDHMASELARLNGKPDKNVYFPFAENASGLEEQIRNRKFNLCGKDAVNLLRTFKPYRGGNEALRSIHDLDILDKHRSLIPHARLRAKDIRLHEFDGPARRLPNGNMGGKVRWGAPRLFDVHFTLERGNDLIGTATPIIEALKGRVDLCKSILEAFAALKIGDNADGNSQSSLSAEPETHEVVYFRSRIERAGFVPNNLKG